MIRTIRGPWYITDTAIAKYLAIRHRPDTPAARDWAAVELDRVAIETTGSGRAPKHIGQHTLQYRGPAPGRLRLIVSTSVRDEGALPQLIDVLPSHGSHADVVAKRGPAAPEGEEGKLRGVAAGQAPMGPPRRTETRATKDDATDSQSIAKRRVSGPGGFRSQEERRAAGKTVVVSVTMPADLLGDVDAARGEEARTGYVVRAVRAQLARDRSDKS